MRQSCASLAIDRLLQPASQFSLDEAGERLNMIRLGIQAGNVFIAGAAGFMEGISVFHADLFDRFETVR